MSDIVLVALITAVPPTVVAFLAWMKGREVHHIVNSQRDAMIKEIKRLEQVIREHKAMSEEP